MFNKLCVLLLILCLTFHACHGRYLNVNEKKDAKNLHFIKNDDVKDISSGVTNMKPELMSKGVGFQREETLKESFTHHFGSHTLKDSPGAALKQNKAKGLRKSLGSFSSWRVPHSKRGEQNPGFNLDYSPPKTHPPAHN